ncbi:MAG: HAMP domain-containing protein, partial [Solirubrobacterales bacterium]|nr:HAMP domain-containing protein [Solirubrobacterales bacterium]
MRHLSIARSLRLALTGLTLVLALIAALGVSALYGSRQRYENSISRSSALAAAAANLSAAGVAEEEVLRDARGPGAGPARAAAAAQFRSAAATASGLARDDTPSARLVAAEIAAEDRARTLGAHGRFVLATAPGGPFASARALAVRLQARQQARQLTARDQARSDSRKSLLLIVAAGLLAIIGAVSLVTLLIGAMRAPLDSLVRATHGLASGELGRRVTPSGPRELRELGAAFNAMGEELSRAQRRIEQERERLAVTIESLGDALIVTEGDSSTIAAVNPRAGALVPELTVGGRADAAGSPLPALEAGLEGETTVEHRGQTLSITAVKLGGERGGVVWTVRDVSERARLERAKSDFVATASHELRSPLTSIKGFVELLESQPENMTERQREFVEIILRSTDRLVELVNDLLDVARIDAEHVEINRTPIDVGEAAREVAELMGPRIAEKHQRLGVYVAG